MKSWNPRVCYRCAAHGAVAQGIVHYSCSVSNVCAVCSQVLALTVAVMV